MSLQILIVNSLLASSIWTAGVAGQSKVDCHKLNVISSNGTCPEEGRYLVPGNCTIYIDCVAKGNEIIAQELHCSMGYFNGTDCEGFDEMITNCPQTECFSSQGERDGVVGEQTLEFQLNLVHPHVEHDNANTTEAALESTSPESTTTSASMHDSDHGDHIMDNVMKMNGENDTATPKSDLITENIQATEPSTSSINSTEMSTQVTLSSDRQGRLIIKTMNEQSTAMPTKVESKVMKEAQNTSLDSQEHPNDEHTTRKLKNDKGDMDMMMKMVMTNATAASRSGIHDHFSLDDEPVKMKKVSSASKYSGASSYLQVSLSILSAMILVAFMI